MSLTIRSVHTRRVTVMGTCLLLLAAFIATPTFVRPRAAAIPFGSDAFAMQWNAVEPTIPNFWGPTYQPAAQEPYADSPGGTRLVQYFDKARMEQTTPGNSVTNGLLTVELITGRRQLGDTAFGAFAPSLLPVVGDLSNTWPPYAALGGAVFAARVKQNNEPIGTVYKPDGTFAVNPGLGAEPGAAFGVYVTDPGGVYAHNVPAAFSAYLAALPLAWQTVMGLPVTEPFWVNVRVGTVPTWVLVQPFERRVLSYTPTNPDAFKVEMGNIGQHYYQWRYGGNSAGTSSAAGTIATGTALVSGTPGALAISSVQLGAATDTSFSLTFKTNIAATSEVLYGTTSHGYDSRQDVSTTAATDHTVSLTGLQSGTKYFFVLRATAANTSVERKEDYFSTSGRGPTSVAASTATNTARPPTDTATPKPTATDTPTPKPTATNTPVPKPIRVDLTQATVNAANPAQLAPGTLALENTSVTLTLTYEGSSSGASASPHLTSWNRDASSGTASSVGASGTVTLTDKQITVVLSATITIPFTDPTTAPIVVTFTRKLAPGDYASGIAVTSGPLSTSKSPGYTVTVSFAVAFR